MTADAVELYFDAGDPWSWVLWDDLVGLADRAGRPLQVFPVALPAPQSYTSAGREQILQAWLDRAAASRGLPPPRRSVPREVLDAAMGGLAQLDAGGRREASRALLEAVWRDDAEPAPGPGTAADLAPFAAQAADRGVFATPTMVVDGEIYWGEPDLRFARAALGEAVAPGPFPPAAGRKLRWFHDFASPYSYLSSTQIGRLERESGVTVQPVPILLGALFREIGTPMVPLQSFGPLRQAWQARTIARWASYWGVDFRFPSAFPFRTVTALRVALLAPTAHEAIYRAGWAQDRDIGDDEVLRTVLDEAGFDGAALLAATQDPAVKEQLKANTAAAAARGVHGVPTFEVGGGVEVDGGHAMVWGQDRLEDAAELLAHPTAR